MLHFADMLTMWTTLVVDQNSIRVPDRTQVSWVAGVVPPFLPIRVCFQLLAHSDPLPPNLQGENLLVMRKSGQGRSTPGDLLKLLAHIHAQKTFLLILARITSQNNRKFSLPFCFFSSASAPSSSPVNISPANSQKPTSTSALTSWLSKV